MGRVLDIDSTGPKMGRWTDMGGTEDPVMNTNDDRHL